MGKSLRPKYRYVHLDPHVKLNYTVKSLKRKTIFYKVYLFEQVKFFDELYTYMVNNRQNVQIKTYGNIRSISRVVYGLSRRPLAP